jgi:hypothetical protein
MLPDPRIPDYWSPEQALAIYEFLDDLRERVWDQYRAQIQEQYRIDRQDDAQPDFFDIDDELPF